VNTKLKITKKDMICAAAGVGAGFVGGLIGTGGGIIIILAMSAFDRDSSRHDIFARTIAIILPMSLLSVWLYHQRDALDFGEAWIYLIPGALGGLLGAWLMDKIGVKWLRYIFAVLVIVAGAIMIFGRAK